MSFSVLADKELAGSVTHTPTHSWDVLGKRISVNVLEPSATVHVSPSHSCKHLHVGLTVVVRTLTDIMHSLAPCPNLKNHNWTPNLNPYPNLKLILKPKSSQWWYRNTVVVFVHTTTEIHVYTFPRRPAHTQLRYVMCELPQLTCRLHFAL